MSVAFPKAMSADWLLPFNQGLGGFVRYSADAVTQATPLAAFKNGAIPANWLDLFLGSGPGCIGETFRIGIVLGGAF